MFFLGLRRMCLLLSPGGVFCTCHLDPVVMSLLISCLLGLPVTWLLSLQLQPWIVYISLQFYKFLPHVFWCLLGVKPCYVFLKNWPLYHYMSLSSKVCFVYLLLIGVSMAYLSPTPVLCFISLSKIWTNWCLYVSWLMCFPALLTAGGPLRISSLNILAPCVWWTIDDGRTYPCAGQVQAKEWHRFWAVNYILIWGWD